MELRETPSSHRVFVVIAVVACVLQVALAPQISLLGGRFNVMLVLAGTFALTGNAPRAVYVGFFAGLFYDLTATAPVGLMTLLLTVTSFVLASISGVGTSGFSTASLRLFFVDALVVSLVNGIALVIMGYEGSVLVSLGSHGLMSAIMSTVLAIPFLMASGSGTQTRSGFTARSKGGTRFKTVPTGKRLRNLR